MPGTSSTRPVSAPDDMHNDCQKDYKCVYCQGNLDAGSRDCEIWKKEKEITKLKHTQNITYPEARRMVESTKYVEMTKKYTNNQQIKLSYVWNKCNHKTQGGCLACKQNESANPRDENHNRSSQWKILQRPELEQAKRDRQTGRAQGPSLLRWLLFLGNYRNPLPDG